MESKPAPDCAEINSLLRSGRMLDAWAMAEGTGLPLAKWPSGEARRTAASLASSLGASRLSNALDWLNWRENREDPMYFLQCLFSRIPFTPEVKLIREIRAFLEAHPSVKPERRADLLALEAFMHAGYQDFGQAFGRIHEALDLAPEKSWIHVQHSNILEIADRYDDALAAADEAVRLRPLYRAAVLQKVDVLVHLGRDDEAISLLTHADGATQNPAFPGRLQGLYSEREDHVRSLECLARFEERSPLAEEPLRKWIAGRRADFHYMAGDFDEFLKWVDLGGSGFHKAVAENFRKPGASGKRRVRLDVPFVRQHNMTCGPATLAAISRFWGKGHEHLEIAEAICHDGTPWHKERRWAEENGFVAREFRLDRDTLRVLIDRGIPFTLTTQGTTSAHLQACIGYDERCDLVLLRDPTHRHFVEMNFSALMASHPFAGPRGMVMVPVEEAAKLDGVLLPDEPAYDAFHGLLHALDGNDRLRVDAALAMLRAVAGNHALVPEAEERVARWRRDDASQLAAVERQLEIAPAHEGTLLQKADGLRRLGRWHELRAFLKQHISGGAPDPVFISELGELLMDDARHLSEAEHYLWKAIRRRRREARVYESMGRCLGIQQRFAEAAVFRRISANLAPSFEPYARGFFDTCRILGRVGEGIAFLEERVGRDGRKAAGPWLTLASVMNSLNRGEDARKVLTRALEARPDDGELLLRAGSMLIGWGGDRSIGEEWMERARALVTDFEWLAATARNAAFLGDRATAARCWRSLLRDHPKNIEAWRGLARSVAEQDGDEAAIRLLDEATGKQPENASLWSLKAEWLADTKRGPMEALGKVIMLEPENSWAYRERAYRLSLAGEHERAEVDARTALALNPWSAYGPGILGSVLEKSGKTDEAAGYLRDAIRLDVDYTFPARRLVAIARTPEERLEAIACIESEMRRQVSNGEILHTYQALAWRVLEPDVLLGHLQGFCEERPDLWQTWASLLEQALRMDLDGEAMRVARELTERFPLMPRAWLELGRVHRAVGDFPAEEGAIARATEISPGWDEAARAHALVLERLGRPLDAARILRRACQLDPLNGPNYGELADTLRRLGHDGEAMETLATAMRLCPFYSWAWTTACSWAAEDGNGARMATLLESAQESHGHHPSWDVIAAECWETLGETEKHEASVRSGLARNPANPDLREWLAYALFKKNEIEAALAACEAVATEEKAPASLRGRRAWILLNSGSPIDGVAELKALTKSDPHYSWAFSQLADWHNNHGEWQELKELCTRWSRASPDDSRVYGFLGLAEKNLKNHALAKAAFAKAHAKDPSYLFASRQLMDLQMKDREFDQAAETYARMGHFSSGPYIACDGIELDLKRGDPAAALRRAESLLCDGQADADVFKTVSDLFEGERAGHEWKQWLGAKTKEGTYAAPGALVAFLRTLPPGGLYIKARKWMKREALGSVPRKAAWIFLFHTASGEPAVGVLLSWGRKHGAEFRGDDLLWAEYGQALLKAQLYAEGVRWFSGWEEREDRMGGDVFVNLSALHAGCPGKERKRWEASKEIRRRGFLRGSSSEHAHTLRATYALHLAADGDIAEAKRLLQNFDPAQTNGHYGMHADAAYAIIAAAEGDTLEAKRLMTSVVMVCAGYMNLSILRLRKRAERAVASHIPEMKGSRAKLNRRWYPHVARAGGEPIGLFGGTNLNIPAGMWFVIAGVVSLAMRGCIEAASGN